MEFPTVNLFHSGRGRIYDTIRGRDEYVKHGGGGARVGVEKGVKKDRPSFDIREKMHTHWDEIIAPSFGAKLALEIERTRACIL